MERYHMHINSCKTIKFLELTLENMRARTHEFKDITIYEGFLYSFLYIDDVDKIGKGERIIRGRIVKIEEAVIREFNHRSPFYVDSNQPDCVMSESSFIPHPDKIYHHDISSSSDRIQIPKELKFTIIIDASTENHSKIEKLNLTHILDIQNIDFDWEKDNSKLVPEIPETTVYSKEYGKGDEFLIQEYHRPHPSIE